MWLKVFRCFPGCSTFCSLSCINIQGGGVVMVGGVMWELKGSSVAAARRCCSPGVGVLEEKVTLSKDRPAALRQVALPAGPDVFLSSLASRRCSLC